MHLYLYVYLYVYIYMSIHIYIYTYPTNPMNLKLVVFPFSGTTSISVLQGFVSAQPGRGVLGAPGDPTNI